MPESVALFEHQPREHRVPCQSCRTRDTSNDHAVCDPCLDAGASVDCGQNCRDVVRAAANTTRVDVVFDLTPPRPLFA